MGKIDFREKSIFQGGPRTIFAFGFFQIAVSASSKKPHQRIGLEIEEESITFSVYATAQKEKTAGTLARAHPKRSLPELEKSEKSGRELHFVLPPQAFK